MSIMTPERLEHTRAAMASSPVPRTPSVAARRARAIAVVLAALVLAALMSVWPALTLIALGLALIVALAAIAPSFALVGALLLYGLEGTIKVGLARELAGGLGISPNAAGAAILDLAFIIALLALLRLDRGRTPRAIWSNGGRPIRIALVLFGAWIGISVMQLFLSPDLGAALTGFRLSQAYVLAALAGALLLTRSKREHVVNALVAVLLLITAYAAFRGVAGPSESERLAAFARSTTPLVPSENSAIFRNTGSFSSAIGLASFLVPAGVFLFTLGLFVVRLRLAAWIGFALALVALVATYVRTSLLAVAGGAVLAALIWVFTSGLKRRTKLALGLASVPLIVALLALGALAPSAVSGGSAAVAERSSGVLKPLSDPSLKTRFDRWGDSLDIVAANPLGTGLGTVGAATRDSDGTVRAFADNSYLKILQEQGPLGAIPFTLGVLALLIAIAARGARAEPAVRGLGIAAVAASGSLFLLAVTSEAIEQPGKVLAWLFLGIGLWTVAVRSGPDAEAGARTAPAPPGSDAGQGLRIARPGRFSRPALIVAALLVLVPVGVSLSRDARFQTTLEIVPTLPAGNAGGSTDDPPALREVIANPGFQGDTESWQSHTGYTIRLATDQSHSGTASLGSVRNDESSSDGRVASTRATVPVGGRYGVQAWVRLPAGYTGSAPEIALEGYSGSTRLAGRAGDASVRERWQLISAQYSVLPADRDGRLVLRAGPASPRAGQVLHWDDVRVLSNDVGLPPPDEVNLVANPGFERDRSGWGDPVGYEARRSEWLAHSGTASLRTSSPGQRVDDTNVGYTYVVFPRAGTYRVKAWVLVPFDMRDSRPAVFLEGFLGSAQLAQRVGDPLRRGAWQWVATDYEISPQDLEGSLVLRDLAGSNPPARPGPRVLYWDDVSATVPRSAPPSDARAAAAVVRAALVEPQLRSDISSLTAGDNPYEPGRAEVERSARAGTLSFIVRVGRDSPADANSLTQPLRAALLDVARRGMRRQALQRWQQLITIVGESLAPDQRRLLQRRAGVVDGIIGAQPADVVAPRAPPAPAKPLTRAQALQAHERRQAIISRIGDDLPVWQRSLVQQQAEDLQRMVAADTAQFVVLAPSAPVEPTRRVDRLLAGLPGSFPVRVGPISAGVAGLICALLLLVMSIVMTSARRRGPLAGH
jgi:O-antigen ligase